MKRSQKSQAPRPKKPGMNLRLWRCEWAEGGVFGFLVTGENSRPIAFVRGESADRLAIAGRIVQTGRVPSHRAHVEDLRKVRARGPRFLPATLQHTWQIPIDADGNPIGKGGDDVFDCAMQYAVSEGRIVATHYGDDALSYLAGVRRREKRMRSKKEQPLQHAPQQPSIESGEAAAVAA